MLAGSSLVENNLAFGFTGLEKVGCYQFGFGIEIWPGFLLELYIDWPLFVGREAFYLAFGFIVIGLEKVGHSSLLF